MDRHVHDNGCCSDCITPSTTIRESIHTVLTLGFMGDKAEMLSCVENFVDTQNLQVSVKRLIKAGNFAVLGNSNVRQFKKDHHDINFGVRVILCLAGGK